MTTIPTDPRPGAVSPVFLLRALVLALGCSTAIGLWFGITQRAEFVAGFPGAATPWIYAALVATGVLGLVSLLGLWRWRRWGVTLYLSLAVCSITLDLVARAPLFHQVTVVVSTGLMLWAIAWNRPRFG